MSYKIIVILLSIMSASHSTFSMDTPQAPQNTTFPNTELAKLQKEVESINALLQNIQKQLATVIPSEQLQQILNPLGEGIKNANDRILENLRKLDDQAKAANSSDIDILKKIDALLTNLKGINIDVAIKPLTDKIEKIENSSKQTLIISNTLLFLVFFLAACKMWELVPHLPGWNK